MQSAPLLPRTAPFAEEQIAALNSVISVTTAEQRAWLSGSLAGVRERFDAELQRGGVEGIEFLVRQLLIDVVESRS